MLYSFKSQKSDSYVIVWKIEHEHYPTFNTYYVKDGKILKIGEWGIFTPPLADEYYDYFDYSVEDIRIHQKNDEIGISFLKDIEFVDYSEGYSNDWTSYKAGTFTLSFNVVSGEVRRIESGE